MLISHKHKFVTIDVPKTGTRTLRSSLYKTGILDVIGGAPCDDPHFRHHSTTCQSRLGFIKRGWDYDGYFKFAMVRNPWKRAVSFFLWRLAQIKEYESLSPEELRFYAENDEPNPGEQPRRWSPTQQKNNKKLCERWLQLNKCETSFFEFSILTLDPQDHYILNSKGEVDVNMIGSTENINEDFHTFCNKVGIEDGAELEHQNKSTYTKPYTEYYNQELIDLVAKKESWAINKFKYNYK